MYKHLIATVAAAALNTSAGADNKIQKVFISVVLSALSLAAIGQENVSNIRVQQMDNVLIIMYDLAKQANIEVFASFDGGVTYTEALRHVTGAVGRGVSPGVDKMVAWNVLSEFGEIDYPNTVIKVVSTDEAVRPTISTRPHEQNTLFPTKEGMMLIYAQKNSKGKILGYSRQTVRTIDGSGRNITVNYLLEDLSKNQRQIRETTCQTIIRDGVVSNPF